MTRWKLIVTLAAATVAACSQGSQQPSNAPADKAAAPAAAPGNPQPAPTSTPPPASPATPEATTPTRPASTAAAVPPTTPAPSTAAASTPQRAVPAEPTMREVTIPAETAISVTLRTSLASNTSKVEDQVRGTLAKPIIVSGRTAVPAGAEVTGTVLEAHESGRVKGRASIAFRFDRLLVRSESHQIQTARISRLAEATHGEDAKKIGIGAAAGAVIGGIAGGGKGAAIGAGVGGGAGTGAVLATRGKEVTLPAGTVVSTRLREPITVLVPIEK